MALNSKFVENILFAVIFLIIIYQVLADTSTDIGYAADNITAASETLPLTNFFKKKGVVLLSLMAGVAIVIIKSVMAGGK